MTDENKYVLRHELESTKGAINKRINEVDNKHTGLNNDLNILVTRLTESNNLLISTQDKTNSTLEKINNNLTGFNDRIRDVEYITEDTTKRLDVIEKTTMERQKGNIQIWVAIISAIAAVIVGALGFAQIFF